MSVLPALLTRIVRLTGAENIFPPPIFHLLLFPPLPPVTDYP